MDKKLYEDMPLSKSDVSLKLAVIQKRCAELIEDADSSIELTLEEAIIPSDAFNPYDHA
jgi:hypothetical protein